MRLQAANETRRLGFLLAIPATAILFAALAGAQAGDPLLQQAEQLLQKKDYAGAAQALETYLAHNPEDYRAEFNLAYAYSLTGRRAEAIEKYKNVLARQPDLIPAHLNLGILLADAGQSEEAVSHLRTVVEKEPENTQAILRLAQSLAALKRVPEASEAYQRLLKLKPEDAHAHFAYAMLIEDSNPALGEEHLRRAIQLNSSLDEARLQLASLLASETSGTTDPLPEAAGIYRSYLEQHPERRDLRVRLGEIYVRQKQFSDAAAQFEMARAAGDSSLPVSKELLRIYLAADANKSELQKNSGKAITLVQEILNQDGRDVEMRLLYGKLLLERKLYREAAEQYREATVLQPQSPDGYRDLASALYLLGEYQAAVAALGKISEMKQDTAGTYFLRAICLDKLRILKPALGNYQKFLAVSKGENPDQEFQARHRSKTLMLDIQKGLGGGGK